MLFGRILIDTYNDNIDNIMDNIILFWPVSEEWVVNWSIQKITLSSIYQA